jgi:hypothetical protein
MSCCEKDNRDRLTGTEMVLAVILTGILVYGAYVILRWLFTTPEGRQALAVLLPLGALVGIIALIVQAFSGPASSRAYSEPVPAPARHQPYYQPTMAWEQQELFRPGSGSCYTQGALTMCSGMVVRR